MAESLRDIRRRRKSVKTTQQITKAMKMVAAAKLKKAEGRARSFAPYADEINAMLRALLKRSDAIGSIELATPKAEGGTLLLVLAGDRGLCGGFNSKLLRECDRWLKGQDASQIRVCTVGRKAGDWARKRELTVVNSAVLLPEPPTAGHIADIEKWVTEPFLAGEIAQVVVIYNKYNSPLSQVPTVRKLLPVDTGAVAEGEESGSQESLMPFITDVPTPELIARLVEDGLRAAITSVLLDNQAGEHGARMTAMDSATSNASDIIAGLTLRYNRARQAAITNELMDIINGSESVK